MYIIKENIIKEYKKYGLVRKLAKITGLTEGYVSQILNGKKSDISKVVAYAITKALDNNLEIENLFKII